MVLNTMLPKMGLTQTNPGTESLPWKTIQKAASSVKAGDTVYVKKGLYLESIYINTSGTKTSPIRFIGIEFPIIESGQWTDIKITGSHITVQGFEVRGATGFGIQILGSNIVVQDNLIHNNYHEGIRITDARITDASDVLIKGGKIYDNGGGNSVGLWLEGVVNDITVEEVEFYSTGIQEAALVTWEAGGSSGLTLNNVFIHDHPGYGANIVQANYEPFSNIYIINSHFKHNGIGEKHNLGGFIHRSGNLILNRAQDSIIERNVFEEGQGWGVDTYVSARIIFRNNLFINNFDTQPEPVGPGIGLEINAGQDNKVFHNVFYGNSIGFFSSYLYSGGSWPVGPAFNIQNNIFYNNKWKYLDIHYCALTFFLGTIFK